LALVGRRKMPNDRFGTVSLSALRSSTHSYQHISGHWHSRSMNFAQRV